MCLRKPEESNSGRLRSLGANIAVRSGEMTSPSTVPSFIASKMPSIIKITIILCAAKTKMLTFRMIRCHQP